MFGNSSSRLAWSGSFRYGPIGSTQRQRRQPSGNCKCVSFNFMGLSSSGLLSMGLQAGPDPGLEGSANIWFFKNFRKFLVNTGEGESGVWKALLAEGNKRFQPVWWAVGHIPWIHWIPRDTEIHLYSEKLVLRNHSKCHKFGNQGSRNILKTSSVKRVFVCLFAFTVCIYNNML